MNSLGLCLLNFCQDKNALFKSQNRTYFLLNSFNQRSCQLSGMLKQPDQEVPTLNELSCISFVISSSQKCSLFSYNI